MPKPPFDPTQPITTPKPKFDPSIPFTTPQSEQAKQEVAPKPFQAAENQDKDSFGKKLLDSPLGALPAYLSGQVNGSTMGLGNVPGSDISKQSHPDAYKAGQAVSGTELAALLGKGASAARGLAADGFSAAGAKYNSMSPLGKAAIEGIAKGAGMGGIMKLLGK